MRYILCLLFLFLPSFAWAQAFNSVLNPSMYPERVPGAYIPVNSDQAILSWRVEPRGVFTNVTQARIISRVDYAVVQNTNTYGWGVFEGVTGESGYNQYYTICDARNVYIRQSSLSSYVLNQIQELLKAQNLGTVQQRAAYIAGFKAKPPQIVSPGDILGTFTKMLGPWAYVLVGMMIALLALDIGSSKMKKVAGEAAKLERSARRTEINRQIKNDQTARVYQRKLRNMSHFLYTYTDRDDFYRDVRKRFKQTSADYAEYKASKGWIL